MPRGISVGASELRNSWSADFAEAADTWRRKVVSVPPTWTSDFDKGRLLYQELHRAGRWVSGPGSMMGILRRRHLEVEHSRVLAWLLDPRGRHGLGTALLCGLFPRLSDGELDELSVVTEEPCGDEVRGWGFVDIVVRTRESVLVIENKIWAGQHGEQLDLYYDEYVDDGAGFTFLTPGSRRARSSRPEVVEAWRPMGWRRDVIPTLSRLLHERPSPASAAADYLSALREEFRA